MVAPKPEQTKENSLQKRLLNPNHSSPTASNRSPTEQREALKSAPLPKQILAPHQGTDSPVFAYPVSIQRLIRTLTTISPLTPAQLTSVMKDIQVSAYDLIPWANFNHSPYESYGRSMVFHGGQFEIMVMSWAPGDFSAIHDHGHAQWGAVQCFGDADHYVYTLKNNELKDPIAAHYEYGNIHTVDNHIVHQIGNGGTQPFLSLHVYGCLQTEKSITKNARVFDLLEESIQFTDGGVFFCLPEHDIKKRQYGLTGDIQTVAMQYILMRDRLRRMLEVEPNYRLEQKLLHLEKRMRG